LNIALGLFPSLVLDLLVTIPHNIQKPIKKNFDGFFAYKLIHSRYNIFYTIFITKKFTKKLLDVVYTNKIHQKQSNNNENMNLYFESG
jgi:hypothetical protein